MFLKDGDSELPLSTRSGFKAFFQELSSSYNIVIYTSYFSIEVSPCSKVWCNNDLLGNRKSFNRRGSVGSILCNLLNQTLWKTHQGPRNPVLGGLGFLIHSFHHCKSFLLSIGLIYSTQSEERKKSLPFQISNLIAIDFSTSDKILIDLVDFFMVNQIQSEVTSTSRDDID